MTAILSTPGQMSRSALPARSASPSGGGADGGDRRARLQQVILANETSAQQAAQQGDLVQAARHILAALDGERRIAASGPQVLQVIKPRA